MPVNLPMANNPNGAGVLLRIDPVPTDNGDGKNTRLLAALRQVADDASIRWMSRDAAGIRVLIGSDRHSAEQIAEAVRDGAVARFNVTHARIVDLAEWHEDIELVQRMLQEDNGAMRAVIAKFGDRIMHSLARRFRDVLDQHDVDECLNHAAWKLWRFANKFDPDRGSLGTWFYKVAEREVYDLIRNRPSGTLPLEFDPGATPRVAWGSTSRHPNGALINDLNAVIDMLPKVQKAVILADIAAGERADDEGLAARLKTSVNSIRVSRHKAKKRIALELGKRGHASLEEKGPDQ